jgi:hypothetical protein
MSVEHEQQKPVIPPDEQQIDQAIEDTFPASDPSATTGGTTKINPHETPDSAPERAIPDKP